MNGPSLWLADLGDWLRWHIRPWQVLVAGSVGLLLWFAFTGNEQQANAPGELVAYQEQLQAGVGDASLLENVTPPRGSKTTIDTDGELLVATVGTWAADGCWAVRLLVDNTWLEGGAGNSHVSDPYLADMSLCPTKPQP